MATADDRALVERLRAGDVRAFDEVYARYRARLFTFLLRLVRRREVAEELLQEAWFRLARDAVRLRDGERLGPWLFAVVRNQAASWHRRNVLDRALREVLGRFARGTAGPGAGGDDWVSAREDAARLEAALGALPFAQREVLLLVAERGLEPGEVARILGIQPAAARQRLSRARAALSARLGEAE